MPIYRSINIKLHSQFDIETLPEYIPRSRDYYASRGIPAPERIPLFVEEATSTCSVYVKAFPNSQFWLSYAVNPPVPEDQLFLFKLYINGAHIMSWNTGKEEKWKGKTMFALFEVEDGDGRSRVEKRVLCFTSPVGEAKGVEECLDEKSCLEIRVHRALGRQRAERQIEEYSATEYGRNEHGVRLVHAGIAGSKHPKRFYKFALVDPIDKPYATFRYYYRAPAQIREMGLAEEGVIEDGESNELSVIEPCDLGDNLNPSPEGDIQGSLDGGNESPGSVAREYIPKLSPNIRGGGSNDHSETHQRVPSRFGATSVPSDRGLLLPPSCKFDPPQPSKRSLPMIPQKQDPDAETKPHPHPVYPIDDWEMRTPSPVQSLRESISTPTFEHSTKGRRTPTEWFNAVADAWRRRAATSSDDGSRAPSRSDSRGVREG